MERAIEPWEKFADVVLQRMALIARLADGLQPRDFAGMFVDHADVDRILTRLPGLDGPGQADLDPVIVATEAALTEARDALEDSLDTNTAFGQLVKAASLRREDAEILALLVRVELSPSHQRLVSYIQDAVALPRLTMATLMRFADDPSSFGPDSRLRRSELIVETGDGPWSVRMLAPAERVSWAIVGDEGRDPDLPPDARIESVQGLGASAFVVVSGADPHRRKLTGAAMTSEHGLIVSSAPSESAAWRALVREAVCRDVGILIEADEPLDELASSFIGRAAHLTWVLSFPTEPPIETLPNRPWEEVRLESVPASPEDWSAVVGRDFSGGHRLDRTQLHHVGRAVQSGQDVAGAIRRLAAGHLDDLAILVQSHRSWDDLVLPPEETTQLRELVGRFRHRATVFDDWKFHAVPSAGLVAVFAGPSGTGKTLAAEVIATDLGLDLYKVDLSSVVSKYIGETEKNLERIFNAASAGEVVLFFDEADALFGKRSDVGDAHDRYANIEVAYLLQRLETYDGIVVLATNLQRNMDNAFLRRIQVAIEFPMPDESRRRRIWELSFPEAAPTGDLDTDFLARQFKVSGGSIRNAALTAGFLAAGASTPISMDTVMLGLKREFEKLGRLRTEADFDRYYHLVSEHLEQVAP